MAKAFGPVVALRAVDLTVLPGEAHALLGANGAGKSTMVKILTGVLRADAGSIALHGRPTELRRPSDAQAAGLAPVFQDPALTPDLTVAQNLRLSGSDIGAVRAELAAMDLDGLDLDEQVRDLPLPFLRMLDLARALAFDPQLLVLDEITAALPPDLSDRVFAVMQRWKERNRSVLFISHRLAEVRAHCDMCTVLRDGRNVASFVPGEGGEAQIVSAMLGEAATVVRDEVRAACHGDGHGPAAGPRSRARRRRTAARRRLAGRLSGGGARTGRPRGSGAGNPLRHPRRQPQARPWTAAHRRRAVKAHHPFDVIRKGVVLVPADRLHALLPQRSIRENIAAPLFNRIAKWGPISGREERRRVQEAVDRLSIDTRAASQVRRLSGGNQQKVTIARWFARGLRVMLLFDPTRGIDVGTKHQVYDLVRALADEGAAILMFTSELREVAMVCDRSAVLHNGRIVAELPPDAGENALLSAAHGLEVAS